MLIDIHCHLDHCYFDGDRDRVVKNAKKANVKIILTAGIDPETNKKTLRLAEKYDIVKPCLGIYPIQILQKEIGAGNFDSKSNNFDINEVINLIEKNRNKIAAIGEVGLDYHWIKDNKKEQKDLFEKMISLAEKVKKPIIVHSRKAEEDCINILKSSRLRNVIMHCFTGKRALVKKIVDNGWFLTAPTSVIRSAQFQENVVSTPINQLFAETDAPYLSPYKNRRNEPAFILESYKKISELKQMDFTEVTNNIWMNWQKVFKT